MVDYIQLYFILYMITAFYTFYTNFIVISFDTSETIVPSIYLYNLDEKFVI